MPGQAPRPLWRCGEDLGHLEGLKKAGIQPHTWMIHRVPEIPPQFRPYQVAGNTFVPREPPHCGSADAMRR